MSSGAMRALAALATTVLALGLISITCAASAPTQIDAQHPESCAMQNGPGFLVKVDGLKDRSGRLVAQLYPAAPDDFLKGEDDLRREGKVFRRTITLPNPRGPSVVCIDAPGPGRFALVVIHDRDGKFKFDIWSDGLALIGNSRLGRRRPAVAEATVTATATRQTLEMHMQYMRGLSGFGPTTG
ncbi:DUF2141 domain-containing protein [Novosphingobium sp. SG720]|uniref:DUF2141 domain-containing protein n=1 Tax=Novosphingobium sp. SG720 TaxID=2586998 RepID=UPI0014466498|nr:DUF2141 domain-containing protein [Novosphingobium sp. SG720]